MIKIIDKRRDRNFPFPEIMRNTLQRCEVFFWWCKNPEKIKKGVCKKLISSSPKLNLVEMIKFMG